MAKKIDITGKMADKGSPERKGTSIISEFKQFFGQDSIYEEYEILLSDKDLWALMQIPFSPELAEVTEEISEPSKPAMETKAVVSSKDEQIIREAIARQLDKAPSQLTSEDFQNLTKLDLSYTSLTKLDYLINLTNLQLLWLNGTQVSNLEPIKGLTNMQELWIGITHVSDLAPIKGLTNLQRLWIDNTQVSNLEPLKGLTKLILLYLEGCRNITDQQVEDLQKVLPELEIIR